jgi:hypothetical protein
MVAGGRAPGRLSVGHSEGIGPGSDSMRTGNQSVVIWRHRRAVRYGLLVCPFGTMSATT